MKEENSADAFLTLTDIYLLKSRSGRYEDNAENRRLHRVGQLYGKPKQDDSTLEGRNRKYKENGWDYNTTSIVEFAGDPKRKQLHKTIIDGYRNRATRVGNTPVATFTLGGGGAGKGTVLRMLQQHDPTFKDLVVIDSDDIKTKSFKEDFDVYNQQNEGSAARRLHDESSMVADKVVNNIIEDKNDYLKDGTMKDYDKSINDIKRAKDKGYNINIVGVTIPVETAIKRAELRGKRSGRVVPTKSLIDAHKGSTDTFLRLIESGLVDDMKLYDNSGTVPILIYDSSKRNPILNKKLFEEFKNKKNYTMKQNNDIQKSYNFDNDPNCVAEKKRWLQMEKECGRIIGVDCSEGDTPEEVQWAIAYDNWIHNGKGTDI